MLAARRAGRARHAAADAGAAFRVRLGLGRRRWQRFIAALQRFIVAQLGDQEAIVVLDETAELKKGTPRPAWPGSTPGITGQVENCQKVVFAAYVTARAHVLSDFRLYLPKAWCVGQARREKAHVPEEAAFSTKPTLARR